MIETALRGSGTGRHCSGVGAAVTLGRELLVLGHEAPQRCCVSAATGCHAMVLETREREKASTTGSEPGRGRAQASRPLHSPRAWNAM